MQIGLATVNKWCAAILSKTFSTSAKWKLVVNTTSRDFGLKEVFHFLWVHVKKWSFSQIRRFSFLVFIQLVQFSISFYHFTGLLRFQVFTNWGASWSKQVTVSKYLKIDIFCCLFSVIECFFKFVTKKRFQNHALLKTLENYCFNIFLIVWI